MPLFPFRKPKAPIVITEENLFPYFNQRIEEFYKERSKKFPSLYLQDMPQNWTINSHNWSDLMCDTFLSYAAARIGAEENVKNFLGKVWETPRGPMAGVDGFLANHSSIFLQLGKAVFEERETEAGRNYFSKDYDAKGYLNPQTRGFIIKSALLNVLLFHDFCRKNFPQYVEHVFNLSIARISLSKTPTLPALVTPDSLSANMPIILGTLNEQIQKFYHKRKTYLPKDWNPDIKYWNDLMCYEFLSLAWKQIIAKPEIRREIAQYLNQDQARLHVHSALIAYNPLFAQLSTLSRKITPWEEIYRPTAHDYVDGKFYNHTTIAAIRAALFTVLVFEEFCLQYFPQYVSNIFALAQRHLKPKLNPDPKFLFLLFNREIELIYAEYAQGFHRPELKKMLEHFPNSENIFLSPDSHNWSEMLCNIFLAYAYEKIVQKKPYIREFLMDYEWITQIPPREPTRPISPENPLNKQRGLHGMLSKWNLLYAKLISLDRDKSDKIEASGQDYNIILYEFIPGTRLHTIRIALQNLLVFQDFCRTHLPKKYELDVISHARALCE